MRKRLRFICLNTYITNSDLLRWFSMQNFHLFKTKIHTRYHMAWCAMPDSGQLHNSVSNIGLFWELKVEIDTNSPKIILKPSFCVRTSHYVQYMYMQLSVFAVPTSKCVIKSRNLYEFECSGNVKLWIKAKHFEFNIFNIKLSTRKLILN